MRRREVCFSLIATLTLVGCLAPDAALPPVKGASAAPKTPVGPRATAGPGGDASPGPGLTNKAQAPAAVSLVRPLADSTRLTGRIRADAAYMRGAGRLNLAASGNALIGADGASIVAAGAGNAIAVTGDDLAARGGVGIVAAGGGNILAAGGAGLIGADGASLIGADGASLIGADGASLIGADGASLIGADGASLTRSYTLGQAAEAGRQVPVGGMLVSVVSLARREYLPVGETPDGKPVYTVYADAEGGFSLTVPKGEETNVMLVASLAGRKEAGTIFNAITPPAAEVEVDEDAALVTRYLRRAMVRRLAELAGATSLDAALEAIASDPVLGESGSAARTMLQGLATTFQQLGGRRGIPGNPDRALAAAQADVLTAAVIDDALSRLEVGEIMVDAAITPAWADDSARLAGFPAVGARARDVVRTCFQVLRERAAAKMATPAGTYAPLPASFFARVAIGPNPGKWLEPSRGISDWFSDVVLRYPSGPYPIAKPAEIGDFMVERYLSVNRQYVTEPVIAAYLLLDPATYPAEPSRFPAPGELADTATAMLARLNAHFGGFGGQPLTPTDPFFSEAGRSANQPYADAIDAAAFAFFVQVGLTVTADVARANAVVDALTLPATVPPAE